MRAEPGDHSDGSTPTADVIEPLAVERSSPASRPSLETAPTLPPVGRPGVDAGLPVVDPAHYEIVREHARGGMGRIMVAHDRRLGRTVAVKELLAGDDHLAARFVREARLTARLEHPSIVPVHEAGCWPDGTPFYAMKLVSGRPLSAVIKEARTLDARLALVPHVLAVAEAMAYAHARRIIHRDLKPPNVLVGAFGETVVVDWGIAKDLGESGAADPVSLRPGPVADGATEIGSVVGTPVYMAPEQARGEPVDERADVYALGVLLYQVLSGKLPYDARSAEEVLVKVRREAPVPLVRREREVPPDLAAIVAKAMAREPGARYPSARELAEDLGRFAGGQLIKARRYGAGELLLRWLKRHRLVVVPAALSAVILVVVGGLAVAGIARERTVAVREREEARAARAAEAARVDELVVAQARSQLEIDPTESAAWLKRLRPESEAWLAGRVVGLEAVARSVATHVLAGHEDGVNDVAFGRGGRDVITAGADGAVRVFPATGGAGRALDGGARALTTVAVAPDGTIAAGGADGAVLLFAPRAGGGEEHAPAVSLEVPAGAGGVSELLFTPDGALVVAGTRGGLVVWWDRAGARRGQLAVGGEVAAIRAAPAGDRAFVRTPAAVREVRFSQGEGEGAGWSLPLPGASARAALDLTSDGTRLAVVAPGGAVLVDTTTGTRVAAWRVPGDPPAQVAVTPDGRRLAVATLDGAVRTWRTDDGIVHELAHGLDRSRDLRFSPDGRFLAVTRSLSVRLYDMAGYEVRKLRGHDLDVTRVAFSADGHLATASLDGTVRVWDPSVSLPARLRARAKIRALAAAPDGRRALIAYDDGVALVDLYGGTETPLEAAPGIYAAAWSPGGTRVAWAGSDGRVRVRALVGGAGARDVGPASSAEVAHAAHSGAVLALAFVDERTVVSGGQDGGVAWIDVERGVIRRSDAHEGAVIALAASPVTRRVASAGADGAIVTFTRDGQGTPAARATQALLAFTADGERLAIASAGAHTIELLDVAAGTRVTVTDQNPIRQLGFLADAPILVTGTSDGLLVVRDLAGRARWVIEAHEGPVAGLAVVPGAILSADEAGQLRLQPLLVPAGGPAALAFLAARTDATLAD